MPRLPFLGYSIPGRDLPLINPSTTPLPVYAHYQNDLKGLQESSKHPPNAPIHVLPPDQLAQLYAQLQPSPDAEIGTFCAGCGSPQVLASTRALSVTIDPATGETTQEPGEDVLHWCARCFVQRFDSVQITGATPTGEPSA